MDTDKTKPYVSLHDVSVDWDGKSILSGINMSVSPGDFIAITGPNGGGKTTLLRILLGLVKPTSGTVQRNVNDIRIGYLPQKNSIDSKFPITVREVIMSGLLRVKEIRDINSDGTCTTLRLDNSLREKLYRETLRQVGLEEKADSPIGNLSGGQVQRALLGRAIISKPSLLIMDEPLSYLDKHFEQKLYELMDTLAPYTTIVLVSHEMSTIAQMANRHLIVDRTLHECTALHHFIHTDCTD